MAKINTGRFSQNSQYLYVCVYICVCIYIYTHTHKIGVLEDLWKRLWKLEEHFHFHVVRASAVAKYRILHCRWTRSEKRRKQRLAGACLRYLPACLPSAATLPVACFPSSGVWAVSYQYRWEWEQTQRSSE